MFTLSPEREREGERERERESEREGEKELSVTISNLSAKQRLVSTDEVPTLQLFRRVRVSQDLTCV